MVNSPGVQERKAYSPPTRHCDNHIQTSFAFPVEGDQLCPDYGLLRVENVEIGRVEQRVELGLDPVFNLGYHFLPTLSYSYFGPTFSL